MKLICAKNELLKSVNISLKAVSSKTTMPILECILIDASATEITFTSNDMELGIETKVKGIIEEKGIVVRCHWYGRTYRLLLSTRYRTI